MQEDFNKRKEKYRNRGLGFIQGQFDHKHAQMTGEELKEDIIEWLASSVRGQVEIGNATFSPEGIDGFDDRDYDYLTWSISELGLSGSATSFLDILRDIIRTLTIEIQAQRTQHQKMLEIINELYKLANKPR